MAQKKKLNYVLDSNAWMSTYTDLMTLLLTFFVLLLSLSTMDKNKKRSALESLVGAFGFKPGGQSVLGNPKGLNITTGSAPMVPEDVQFESLRNIALRNGVKSKMEISKQLDRTVIVLKDKAMFGFNSSVLLKDETKFLSDLAGVLKESNQLIELRGYCDSSETVMGADPFKASMILSSKRAMALFDFFVEKGLPPGEIVAHGFGQNNTGELNNPEESYLNRQVAIILDYREKIPFKMRKYSTNDGILDFNGFFFRTARDMNVRR